MIEALDHRSARIKAELDEARRLRDEAGKLLAEYQRKQGEAEREAEAIVADAKAEAERVAAEARAKMEEFVARRTKLAESQDRPGRSAGSGRRTRRRRRRRGCGRREDPARYRQGQGGRRPDRPGHRRREGEAELEFSPDVCSRLPLAATVAAACCTASPAERIPCAQPVYNGAGPRTRLPSPMAASIILPRESS